MHLVPFADEHLEPILHLCEAEGWPTLASDPARARRALSSSITLVAVDGDETLGFAQVLTDGAVEAYLANLVVAERARRTGLGRRLLEAAFERSGAIRIDLLALADAEPFYASFAHRRLAGFRIYPA